MRLRFLNSLALILVAAGLTACGGGSSGSSTGAAKSCATNPSNTLCLTTCNLGCSTVGCELTEIAQNQPLIFTFSQAIDPLSVNTASISLKTASGEEPVGRYIVNGSTVTFLPEVRTVGGTTFFGFDPSARYTLQIPGGPNNINALVSTSGDRLPTSFSCTLNVSLGVLDLDGRPPSADLLEPRVRDNVSRDLLIVMEFSEIIDVAPFFGTDAATGPIRFLLRRAEPRIDPMTGMEIRDPNTGRVQFDCNSVSAPTALFGSPRVQLDAVRGKTIVTYRSPRSLPGDSCVEIVVTDRVKDLAGTPARLQVFRLFTETFPTEGKDISEEFMDETNMDRDVSSGSWSSAVDPMGEGVFGTIGGQGSHGEFSLRLARQVIGETINGVDFSVYEMDTDRTVVTGNNTLDGKTAIVTDGVFSFSKFELPPRTKLRFVGSKPPQFNVRGVVDIEGIIDLHGGGVPGSSDDRFAEHVTGQPGGAAGASGGAGGAGGDKPDGVALQQRFNGQDGGAGRVVAGHAYMATAQNTGGKGSLMIPADGLWTSTVKRGFQVQMVAAGGGGGGHVNPGGNGTVVKGSPTSQPDDLGPDGEGGEGYPPLLPLPMGSVPHEHFLIGGSGGGGGGGHPLFAFNPTQWKSSAGGAGGAGAILLRAGHRLTVGPDSVFDLNGGSAGIFTTTTGFAPASPGGGGSGGAIVLQCGSADRVEVSGAMQVSGGSGGRSTSVGSLAVEMRGGDGSDGLVRMETPLPLAALGVVDPPEAASIGELTEIDERVGFQSLWFDTGEFFPPEYQYYKLEVEIDGNPMTFSDSQTDVPGSVLATPGQPVVFRVQGAVLDIFSGEPDPQTLRPWRFFVGGQGEESGQLGLIDDAATGFRFLIILDRSAIGPGAEVVIKKLTIHYEA